MKTQSKPLIIIAHASVGTGHKKAAEAITEAFIDNTNCDVREVDILDYFFREVDGNKVVRQTGGVFSPIFDFTWKRNFTGRILWAGGNLWPSFLYKKFENLIFDLQPDAVVCTHFVCANAAAKARLKMDKKFPIVSVPTDYETEGLWPHKETDLFCVGSKEMYLTLKSRRVKDKKIVISGIPISSRYRKRFQKKKNKELFNIPQDKTITTIIAGSSESAPYNHMRKTINACIKFFKHMDWIHFVICVGKDEKYESKVRNLIKRWKVKNITVVPYTEKLPELMSCSDIAIVKPGGLVVTECMCLHLPMILAGKTYAQEDINREFLTSNKAAIHASSYFSVIDKLCRLTSDPKLYNSMLSNAKKISNVKASKTIVDEVMYLINQDNFGKRLIHNSIYLGKSPNRTW